MKQIDLSAAVFVALMAATPVHSAITEQEACASGCVESADAVVLANRPNRVAGPAKVVMTVRAVDVGTRGPNAETVYYLNSEDDYRSQISLNLQMSRRAANDASKSFGLAGVRRTFLGKRIVIEGTPTRVQIFFTCNGKPTDLYYYQTHLNVEHAEQITIVVASDNQTSSTNRP
jgi:hypothetical protein